MINLCRIQTEYWDVDISTTHDKELGLLVVVSKGDKEARRIFPYEIIKQIHFPELLENEIRELCQLVRSAAQ